MRHVFRRDVEVDRMRARLERVGFPRLRMTLIVALTGAAGFIVSFALLKAGVLSMPLRYAIAMLAAYGTFLLLLRDWLRNRPESMPDGPDVSGWDGHSSSVADTAAQNAGSSFIDGFGADELAIPLLLIAAVVTLLLASLWIVASAPTLFAELFVDGVLSASLYRRLRGLEARHWLDTALRRTFWPFAITAFVLVLFGVGAQHYAPGAHSIGAVIEHARRPATE